MTNKENFDKAIRKILTVSKAELQRRMDEEKNRPRVGKKRGPKPSAFRALGVSGSR